MTDCPACGLPLDPGALVVPVTRIGDDGHPETRALDFAHKMCPNGTLWPAPS
jgi:hypothetical protein